MDGGHQERQRPPAEFRRAYFEGKRSYEMKVKNQIERAKQRGSEGWGVFQSGIEGYDGYFQSGKKQPPSSFFSIGGYDAQKLKNEVADLHRKKQKVLVADFFGQGVPGVDIDADAVLTTSLTPFLKKDRRIHSEYGDGLSDLVTEKCFAFIDKKKEEGYEFHTVFFRPVGGVWNSDGMNVYVVVKMYQMLRQIYVRMMVGGNIFFTAPHQQVALFFKEIIEGAGLHESVSQLHDGDTRFLLKKNFAGSLPDFDSVMRKHPTILTRMLSLQAISKRLDSSLWKT